MRFYFLCILLLSLVLLTVSGKKVIGTADFCDVGQGRYTDVPDRRLQEILSSVPAHSWEILDDEDIELPLQQRALSGSTGTATETTTDTSGEESLDAGSSPPTPLPTPPPAPTPPPCEPCDAGFYGPGTENCIACADGTFTSTTGASQCAEWSACSAGNYVVTEGTATSDRACAPCPAGKYGSGENDVQCSPCPGDLTSDNGQEGKGLIMHFVT